MTAHAKPPTVDPDAFVSYRNSGWQPIPLHRWNRYSRDKHGKPRSDGKRPRDFDWTRRDYDPAVVITSCIRNGWNMGVRLSARQLVVDVDQRHNGIEGFKKVCHDFRLNPEDWPRVETGSGGSHYYLTLPEGVSVVDTLERYPGVEFKSLGRQVVAAGSIHPNGKPYFWDTIDHTELADACEAPAHLVKAIRRPKRTGDLTGGGDYAPYQVAEMLASLDPTDFRDHGKWLRLMMACHHASNGEALSEWIEWSTSDPHYAKDADVIGRRWESLHADAEADRVTYRTLLKFVQDHGDPQTIPAGDASGDFDAAPDEEARTEDECSELDGGCFRVGGLEFTPASSIKSAAIEWLWKHRFAIGKLSMIAGFPEQGKSQLCCNIVAAVTKGGSWPNDEGKAVQGTAIILSAEDSDSDTLKPRLVAAGANMDRVVTVGAMVRVESGLRMLNLADDLKRLSAGVRKLRERGHFVRLVIIDPISAYMGGKSKGDTFKNSDVRSILAPVSDWAEKERVALIVVSHFNKGGNAHTLYRVTDSIAFTAATRSVWFCIADKYNGGGKLFLKGKNNIGPPDTPGLAYKIATKSVTLDDGNSRDIPLVEWVGPVTVTAEQAMAEERPESPALGSAVDFLRGLLSPGPMLVDEIKEHVSASEHSWATIRRAKATLGVDSCRDGFGGDGRWRWSLPNANLLDDFEEALDD